MRLRHRSAVQAGMRRSRLTMDAPATARLFVALWPDGALRQRLAEQVRHWRWPRGARLVAPENLHLTLHFLGSQPRGCIAAIDELLRAVRSVAFELALQEADVWRGGVAVLESTEVPGELAGLHAVLGEGLRRIGIEPERRPWRPHVTLARRARGAVASSVGLPLRWHGCGAVLVESRDGYHVVSTRLPCGEP
jgi:2'-5' RNA ligase